jgi:hypothetical protein
MVIRHSTLLAVAAAVVVSAALVIGNCSESRSTFGPMPAPEGDPNYALLQPPVETEGLLVERFQAKEELIRRLVAGETRLAEVTASFLRLYAGSETYLTATGQAFPAPTPEASVAQNVIHLARDRVRDDPARRAEVLARLQAEYEAEHGPVPPALVE